MLTENQEKYLRKIPEGGVIKIKPWDPEVKRAAEGLIAKIKSAEPGLGVLWMGASALGIAGQNDIDMYICSQAEDFWKHLARLKEVLGEPVAGISIMKWEMDIDGFGVELYLTDPSTPSMLEQIKVFEILKNDAVLLKEYEKIKLEANGVSFREYMRRKYKFFNRILSESD